MKDNFKTAEEILKSNKRLLDDEQLYNSSDILPLMKQYASQFFTREQVKVICEELLGVAATGVNLNVVTDKRTDTGLYWKNDDGTYQMVEINRKSITDILNFFEEVINKLNK